MLTEYGRAAMMRITQRWKGGEEGFNAARLRKVIRKYVDLDFRKGGIYARRSMAENHGIDIGALEEIAPAYLEKTPAECQREIDYEDKRELEELDRLTGQMLDMNVLYGYHSLDILQFSVCLFGNRQTPELAPLAPFFEGQFESHKKLVLYFQDDYSLEVEMESFPGDDLARTTACSWELKKSGIVTKNGKFEDGSRRNHVAIAGKAMRTALQKVCVINVDARSCLDPCMNSGEVAACYRLHGPFVLTADEEEAEVVFERKNAMLWQIKGLKSKQAAFGAS